MNRRPVPGRAPQPGRPLTPQMQRILQEKLARGEELPPGFVAIKEGDVPPPGLIPTGVSAKADGQPIKPPEDLTPFNPIVANNDGITLMRETCECPLPNETTLLQQHIQLLTALGRMDDEVVDIISRGLASYMLVGGFCSTNLKDRVAVQFKDDPALAALHQEIKDRTVEMLDLQKKIQECNVAAQKALQSRWDKAVKSFGLSPAKNFYTINEEEGAIHQLHIDCTGCKGKTKLRKSRQEAAAYLAKVREEKRKEAEASAKPPAKKEESKNG